MESTMEQAKPLKPTSNGESAAEQQDTGEYLETRCGVGTCRPKALDSLANLKSFTFVMCCVSIFTTMNFSYYSAVITQIERRFGLTSSMTGFIKNIDNIGYIMTVLFAGHMCRYTNKPRLFAACTVVSATAIFCFGLPHFIYGGSDHKQKALNFSSHSNESSSKSEMCDGVLDKEKYDPCKEENSERFSIAAPLNVGALVIFVCSELLQGMANAPKHTMGMTYMDDNARKNSPKYFGFLFAIRSFAPICGFMLGAWTNSMHVDLKDSNMDRRDPRWVGAWWLGFVICGSCTVVWALPYVMFPPYLKGEKVSKEDRERIEEPMLKKLLDMPRALRRVFTNKVYLFITLGTCADIWISGFFTFLPKYLELHFSITATQASLFTGAIGASAWIIGPVLSGFIVSHFKMTAYKTVRMIVVITVLSIAMFTVLMFLTCPQEKWANNSLSASPNWNLPCNSNCSCDSTEFKPICGSDGVNYLNPCQAGCATATSQLNSTKQFYSNCACIGGDGSAKPGYCTSGCKMVIAYAVVLFLSMLIKSMFVVPTMTTFLRVVESKDKGTALAGASFAIAILTFPAPIAFGKVIDTACMVHQTGCSRQGACLLYNPDDFRFRLHGSILIIKVLSLGFYLVAWYHSRGVILHDVEEDQKEAKETEMQDMIEKKEPKQKPIDH